MLVFYGQRTGDDVDKFTYLGGTAYCRRARESQAGIVEMGFGGLVGRLTLDRLRTDLLGVGGRAPASVVRLDRALILLDEVPMVREPPETLRPAAFVVRADQRDLWIEYSHQLMALGVMRAVFLDSQAELAYRWAERMAPLVLV